MNLETAGAVLGEGTASAESFATTTADLPADRWIAAATAVRDDPRTSCDFFDWLSAYDDGAAGLVVAARVWSLRHRHGLVLRTRVAGEAGRLPSLTAVWAGADWHERETMEMFGIGFDGHPNPLPLLLPDGFEGHPLRKEFVLASRVAKEWPGAKEPGEGPSDPARPKRRRVQPPGVPAPGSWGPAS